MRGRKKNRAEKYDASESLDVLWEKAANGHFSDKALWMFRDAVFSGVDNRRKEKAFETLGWMLEGIVNRKAWDELIEMRKIFVAHETWDKQQFKVSDQLRCLLFQCNQGLHELAYLCNQRTIKAGDLLRLFRLANEKYNLSEAEIDDASIYRIMRELGLPRQPEEMEVKEVIAKNKKLSKKDQAFLKEIMKVFAVKMRWRTGK